MIEHRSVVSFLSGFSPLISGKNRDTLSTTHYVFDIFVLEYSLPLLNGCTVKLINLSYPLSEEDCQKIDISHYGFIQLTLSKVDLFLGQLSDDVSCQEHSIILLIGGEPFTHAILKLIRSAQDKFQNKIQFHVINMYGPTETTIWSTYKKIDISKLESRPSYIGKPLPNEKIYLLDAHLNPLPIGAIGELYIGGDKLLRGYLKLPHLTIERFIPNPFQTDKKNRSARIHDYIKQEI